MNHLPRTGDRDNDEKYRAVDPPQPSKNEDWPLVVSNGVKLWAWSAAAIIVIGACFYLAW